MTEALRRAREENVSLVRFLYADHGGIIRGMGPVGEVRIKPDPDTFVTLPYAPGTAAMLSDQVNPDGTPWDGCTRTFRREGAELTPIDESLCYSATGFHLAHDYIIDLVAAPNKQGLEVEHYYPGQAGNGAQMCGDHVPWRDHTACL